MVGGNSASLYVFMCFKKSIYRHIMRACGWIDLSLILRWLAVHFQSSTSKSLLLDYFNRVLIVFFDSVGVSPSIEEERGSCEAKTPKFLSSKARDSFLLEVSWLLLEETPIFVGHRPCCISTDVAGKGKQNYENWGKWCAQRTMDRVCILCHSKNDWSSTPPLSMGEQTLLYRQEE